MKLNRTILIGCLLIAWGLVGGILHAEEKDTIAKLRLTAEQMPGLGTLTSEETWTLENSAPGKIPPEQLAILREYDLIQLVTRHYQNAQGEILTAIYVMKDFKAAFGLYTHLKMPGGKTVRVGDNSIGTADEIVFWQSNYCIHIKSSGTKTPGLNQKIAQTLSQRITHHSEVPVLVTYLPETGLQNKSVRYFLGFTGFRQYTDFAPEDVFGFKDNAEAIVADYTVGHHRGKIILLGYPNHPLSIHYYKALTARLEAKKSEGPVYSKRAGVIVAILVGDFDPATAEKLLGEVTYADSVQWIYDKRGLLARASADYSVVPLLGSVVSALAFTGLLGLFSLGTGILCGGLRFYSRRFTQRSPEETHPVLIRMNLNG